MNEQPPVVTAAPTPAPFPAPAPARKHTGWIIATILTLFFLCSSLFANGVLLMLLLGQHATATHRAQYEETFLQGDDSSANKIAVIHLNGVISGSIDGEFDHGGMVGDIKAQLDQAATDKHVKAIVLRINSPGGEVVASDAIYQALVAVRDDDKKPIVAMIETVGASGAYYAAMGCSHVMATDLSLTGSIGVILQSFSFGGLMDKIGVKSHTFKSGLHKDLLNPTREPTEEEKQMVNTLIKEVYEKFVGIVANERSLDVNDLKTTLADGRVLSGKQALEGSLIDELGYFDDAVDKAMELAKIKKAKVVTYQAPFSLRTLFRLTAENLKPQARTQIQLQLTPALPKLDTGKLYFLPAYMFQ